MKIVPIVYASSAIPESMAFCNGSKDIPIPIDFIIYYVEAGQRCILVDAGCHTMPGLVMKSFVSSVTALEDAGIKRESITDLILTHAHHDHIQNTRYFENARIYIQREEYENGKGYIPDNAPLTLFDEEIEICDGVKAIKWGGHSIGSSIVEITDNGKTYVISGDECYVRRCLTEKIPTGSPVRPEKSLEFIEKYSDPEYTVLLCHEKGMES